jgi:hypothetical protein
MLRDEIENAKRTVNTDTVSITIGEVQNMYNSNELNISPDFQRLFRWEDKRKSNFIESILVGIPIPSVFVFENDNGTWDLIDGLQRISTILEFMGVLRDPESDELRRSKLVSTRYLPSLEGVTWKASLNGETSLDTALQLLFRRCRIDFQILKHPSDPKTKFDLFQRLNRGGAYASEQEVRTCSMVLADPHMTRKMRDFCATEEFKAVFRIGQDLIDVQTDLDYATRIMVHTAVDFPKRIDVQAFLDKEIIDLFDSENVNYIFDSMCWTVNLLFKYAGREALIPAEDRKEGIANRFSLRALEGIVVGIARNKKEISQLENPSDFIRQKINGFWQQQEVALMSASGLRGTDRIQRTVPFGQNWFKPQ